MGNRYNPTAVRTQQAVPVTSKIISLYLQNSSKPHIYTCESGINKRAVPAKDNHLHVCRQVLGTVEYYTAAKNVQVLLYWDGIISQTILFFPQDIFLNEDYTFLKKIKNPSILKFEKNNRRNFLFSFSSHNKYKILLSSTFPS